MPIKWSGVVSVDAIAVITVEPTVKRYYLQSARKRGFRVNTSGECKRVCEEFEKNNKNHEFLSRFCIFLTRREAAITQRKLPSSLTKPRLRTWLSYRVGTAKDGSASSNANKRELMHR